MKKVSSQRRTWLRVALYALLAGLLIGLVVRERDSFGQALNAIQAGDARWLVVGVAAMFASLPASALVYRALSPQPLPFGRTTLVQLAGFCVNKLLPSGSGAVGTSYLYLRAQRVPAVVAGAVVALNNLLGITGHLLLFGLLIALQPSVLQALTIKHSTLVIAAELLATSLVLLVGLSIVLRAKLRKFIKPLENLLRDPLALLQALGASMLITLSYVVCLYACAAAVNVHLTLTAAIIALSSSVLATSVVPTPGGIGAAEAGAYGGLVALGVTQHSALAAALLFRVCTFWIPLLVGSLAFAVVARRGYLQKN